MTETEQGRFIELHHVRKIYRMGQVIVTALNGINLTIDQGELLSVVGPSGSGKSTLMHVIGCLDAPTSGRYVLEGEEVESLKDDRLAEIRNRKIGFVFQTYNLLPRLTALANVELPMLYGHRQKAKQRALEALDKVGLSDRAYHRPTELSGGQQQRVGIARALAKRPSLLLADEPTGNLDSQSSEEILAVLKSLNQEDKMTVIIVTHEADIAKQTRRIISMRDGVIVTDQPACGIQERA